MDILDAVTVADTFPADGASGGEIAELGPIFDSNGGYYNVQSNPVYAQYAYGSLGSLFWTLPVPIPVGPAILAPGTVGVRFKNYVAGKVAVVSGALSERTEPSVTITAGGTASSGSTSSVNLTPVPLASWPPSSPANGDIAVLELPSTYDPLGGKLLRWMFQYDSANGIWQFVGGAPSISEVLTSQTTASAVYTDLATVGPTFTVPRTGEYNYRLAASITNNNLSGNQGQASIQFGATAASDNDSIVAANPTETSAFTEREVPGTQNDLWKMVYKAVGGTGFFERRRLIVLPRWIT